MPLHCHPPFARALLLAATFVTARSGGAQEPQATCVEQLTWAAEYASRNYAGFADKVTPATRPAYDSLLAALASGATAARTDAACDVILRRWVDFFRDRHLSISRRVAAPAQAGAPDTPDQIRARFAAWERIRLDESQATVRLDALGDSRDPLEGIWRSGDGAYRVAVLRDTTAGRDLVMTVLRADSVYWTPGQVKAAFVRTGDGTYATRFYMRDHSEQAWTARVQRNLLRFSSGSAWVREYPAGAELTALEQRTNESRFAAYDIAPGTVVVRVPTFNDPKGIDSLFAAEGPRIRGADRLIVDVRGNGGGSDYNYRDFVPLLYTNPIREAGADMLASDDNIASEFAIGSDTTYPAGQRQGMLARARRMEGSRGGWLRGSDGTRTERNVLPKPRVVAVVADQGCASSCEQFLLAARQSTKVTIYGDRSAGILDYGNVRPASMPNSTLVLSRPISRSRRLPAEPVDNIGIPPHVRIPDSELLPVLWVLDRMRP